MYGREINGGEHTFGVSGKLIMNALVMYDHQTRTLWSQFLGTGVKGELSGVELEVFPVTQTTWAAWRDLHPDTLVLDKKSRYGFDNYRSYYGSGRAGVLGETRRDDRLDGKDLVLGIDLQGHAKAFPFPLLERQAVVNDAIAGDHVLVFYDKGTGTALAYRRSVAGHPLVFELVGEGTGVQATLTDRETGSTWMAFTGRAVDGELEGEVLERLPSHLSFWFAWSDWHPETDLFEG